MRPPDPADPDDTYVKADAPAEDGRAGVPRRIGRYHPLELLGEGGMGVVYAAYDPDLDRRVALKLLRAGRGGPDASARLLREAQALARLSHPNVVQVHDAGTYQDRVFLALELVRGVDLRAWLAARPRGWQEVLRVFVDAGRGLAAAHDAGLVHRDFKPGNVLVGDDGRVRVADFGLARHHADAVLDTLDTSPPERRSTGALAVPLTETGAVLGTPAYMSPEQHEGRLADARGDQFSFCIALWEALFGRHPFAGAGRVDPPDELAPPRARVVDELARRVGDPPARADPDLDPRLARRVGDPPARADPDLDPQLARRVGDPPARADPDPLARPRPRVDLEALLAGRVGDPPVRARWVRRVAAPLRRGLSARPEGRHRDMHALLAALERALARPRRQWLVAAALAGAAATAAGIVAWRGAAADACTGGAAELVATWGPAPRAAVADALRRVGPSPRALAGLDAYAGEWAAAHADACRDNRRGEQSDALLDARVRCLERRRKALAGAVAALTTGGGDEPPDVARVVAGLPPVATCADPERVLAEAPLPDDPALARAVRAVDAALLAARARGHAGDAAGALALAEDAVAAARRLAWRPLLAEALLVRGRAQLGAAGWAEARASFREALPLALAARRDDVAAEAAARDLYAEAFVAGDLAGALADAPVALALAERLPAPHAALALAHNNVGAVQLTRGDLAAAAASFSRAVDELRAAPPAERLDLAPALHNLALVTEDPDRRRPLLAEGTAAVESVLGPDHRSSLDARVVQARMEPTAAAARALLSRTCDRYAGLAPRALEPCVDCHFQLAGHAALLADPAAARAALAGVEACLARAPPPVDPGRADQFALWRHLVAALRARLDRDPTAALAAAAAFDARAAPHLALAWVQTDRAQVDVARGEALLALARPAEAAAALERAVATLTAAATQGVRTPVRLSLAEAEALLARALTTADPARAAALTVRARATFTAAGLRAP